MAQEVLPVAVANDFVSGAVGDGIGDVGAQTDPESGATVSGTVASVVVSQQEQKNQRIILFYKYHSLVNSSSSTEECSSSSLSSAEPYRQLLEDLCCSLSLTGRILVSPTEGINGTLAGSPDTVQAFTEALLLGEDDDNGGGGEGVVSSSADSAIGAAVFNYRTKSKEYFDSIGQPVLSMKPQDFKWSSSSSSSLTASTITTTINNTLQADQLFPDLHIKLVKELIGSGGAMMSIPLEDTSQGYLTPQEWHEQLACVDGEGTNSSGNNMNHNDTILIDCRNTKEFSIGHFPGAIDPLTTTFSQFPKWVHDNQHLLSNKNVLMYCTGGIRCEKASAFIRREVKEVKEVKHLKGGIHKYLEEFGSEGLWQGKNFVFDGRGAASAEETKIGSSAGAGEEFVGSSTTTETATTTTNRLESVLVAQNTVIVGQCVSCSAPFDTFDPLYVCTVCREPTLVCLQCRGGRPEESSTTTTTTMESDQVVVGKEFHCAQHRHLRHCYFSDLDRFSNHPGQLQEQLKGLQEALEPIAIGRRFKQKRKTLLKQMEKVSNKLNKLMLENKGSTVNSNKDDIINNNKNDDKDSEVNNNPDGNENANNCSPNDNNNNNDDFRPMKCRSCGEIGCSGRCWGFYGLKRKQLLGGSDKSTCSTTKDDTNECSKPNRLLKLHTLKQQQKNAKKQRRDRFMEDVNLLQLYKPPHIYRDSTTGVRIPPSCTRILRCTSKGKWCGELIVDVLRQEFSDLSRPVALQDMLEKGLILLNDIPMTLTESSTARFKSSDVVSRIVHWHEAPVIVPEKIDVQTVELSKSVIEEYDLTDGSTIYVINKPSSVPVHPAGPYLSNSLTTMVGAQESLDVSQQQLIPLHRTDRVTSGLTLCSTDPGATRLIHKCMAEGHVVKLYIAQVQGKFVASLEDMKTLPKQDFGSCAWVEESRNDGVLQSGTIEVDVPVETVDPANGVRAATVNGKPSKSIFRLLQYDETNNTSIVSCFPVTGRNHQLRVHLQWLGFPIIGDVLYGGRPLSPQFDTLDLLKKEWSQHREESRLQEISESGCQAAKQACACCKDNLTSIEDAFTAAQLLRVGHAIHLHALTYQISIPRKKKSKTEAEQEVIDVVKLQVAPPDWADSDVKSSLS